jgi:HK97 family phage portal protein
MSTAIIHPSPWYLRAWSAVGKALGLVGTPTEHIAGHSYAVEYGVPPGYEAAASMSAFAAFPWVRAAVMAIAEDLSSLPLVVRRGRGKDAERLEDHPVLALLERPTRKTSGRLFRMQQAVDLTLTGNAFGLVLSASRTRMDPAGLTRLHPARVEVVPGRDGEPEGYEYDADGQAIRYAWDAVLHTRLPSWEDTPSSLFGTGAIQALHDELTAELAVSKRAADAARKGRPDAIASPAQGFGALTKEQARQLADAIDVAFRARHGGVAVLDRGVELKPLGWSPREMEFASQRVLTREAVLAVFGVPPTRVQLPTANYAQSADGMRQYWMTLAAKAALIAEEYTRLARMMDGSTDIYVEHDLSGVAYLQEDRTARLARVSAHILNGMTPAAAYAFEGFADAEVEDEAEEPEPATEPEPAEDDPTDDPETRGLTRAMPRPETEEARAACWRAWARGQVKYERKMRLAAARYLRGAKERIAHRAGNVLDAQAQARAALVIRDLTDAELERIVNSREEAARIREALGEMADQALVEAYRITARQMGAANDLGPAPDASLVEQFIGDLIQQVTQTTREKVGEVVRRGLDNGDTIADITRSIAESSAFAPSRALNIARTESTRALNAGADDAIADAVTVGIAARKEWLSARDGTVRPAHRALDGQIVAYGERFVVPSGVEFAGSAAAYPGDFASAAMVCNCRCTILPVVD